MIKKKPTILITGAAGYLGKTTVFLLKKQKIFKLVLVDKKKKPNLDFFKSQQYIKMDLNNNLEIKLKKINPDLIILAGFLWKIGKDWVKAFPNKIINIHPALLPKYGGKGMYGSHVHKAVKVNCELETGITIHYVNEAYDEGATIFQAKVSISNQDTADEIAAKVHQLEHRHFPLVIEQLLKTAE